MATVKISELPIITQINLDTTQTILPVVDISTDETAQITVRTLADGLFHNDALKVGPNEILLANTVAQFSGNSEIFLQTNLINLNANGSADYVATADIGTNANNYIDTGINNSNFADPVYSAMKPLDGYLYTYGSLDDSADGNLVIGTASAGANVVFIAGGTTESNVVAKITKFGITLNNSSRLEFTDGSIQTVAAASAALTQYAADTANSASSNTVVIQGVNLTQNNNITAVNQYAQSAFATANDVNGMAVGAYGVANTASANTVILQGVNLTQNTDITTANNHAWAAFDKANNALANTTGSFNGTLNILNNLTVNGTVVLANTNFAATEAAFRITAAGSSQTPTQAGTLIQLTNKPNVPARMLIDSFGTSNTAYPIIAGRAARGTVDAPTATQNNDILLRIAGNSYGTTGYAPFGDARIDFVATENHSDTNRGSRIRFWNTPIGSNVVNEIASFNADSVYFTGTVAPEKGFIYSPTILVGNQTAFTIDFATTSLIKATLVADCTISLSNYTYGKVVEVWLTNTSGNQRTITHGCLATNSTTNSTTFNMSATSSAYLRYFSIDGDNANTFVAIQSA